MSSLSVVHPAKHSKISEIKLSFLQYLVAVGEGRVQGGDSGGSSTSLAQKSSRNIQSTFYSAKILDARVSASMTSSECALRNAHALRNARNLRVRNK